MTKRVRITCSVAVSREPVDVFGYLTDIGRHAEWSPKPYRVEALASGPLRVGSTWTSYGWVPGDAEHRNDVEVTELDPPRRLVFDSKEKGESFINTFVLAAEGSGTKVERTLDMPKPGGLLGVVFPLLLPTVVKPGLQKALNGFRDKLQGATNGPAAGS